MAHPFDSQCDIYKRRKFDNNCLAIAKQFAVNLLMSKNCQIWCWLHDFWAISGCYRHLDATNRIAMMHMKVAATTDLEFCNVNILKDIRPSER